MLMVEISGLVRKFTAIALLAAYNLNYMGSL